LSSDTDTTALTPLAPSARWLFHAQALVQVVVLWLPLVVMGTTAGAVALSVVGSVVVGSLVLLSVFLLSVWWPSLAFERWGYAIQEDQLLIAHGVLFRSMVAIPLGRVQHVDVRQGPIEQWLGLARLSVHTASGLGSDGVIPGLEMQVAMGLRDRLVAAGNVREDGV
jgi:membrane protein YdbS with pleckstrin-like domain